MRKGSPNHKVVPNGSLNLDLETEEKLARQANEYVNRGTLPYSFLYKRQRKPETFSEFLRQNAIEATYEFYAPLILLKKGLLYAIRKIKDRI